MLVPSLVPVEIMAWCWRDIANVDADTKQLQVQLWQVDRGYFFEYSRCFGRPLTAWPDTASV